MRSCASSSVACSRAARAALIGLDLLLATAGPRHGEALGDEVVAGVPVLDLDDVAGGTETGDLVREDQLRHVGTP